MSRLDSAIRRLQAQRACLDHAVELVSALPGPVFELGLGNGRTYDHLREISAPREIFVFDRQVAAHPDCIPDQDHLFLGDFKETLAAVSHRFAKQVVLVHADVGSGDPAVTKKSMATVTALVPEFICPGGVLVTDQDLDIAGAEALPLPAGVSPGRYFIYRFA